MNDQNYQYSFLYEQNDQYDQYSSNVSLCTRVNRVLVSHSTTGAQEKKYDFSPAKPLAKLAKQLRVDGP